MKNLFLGPVLIASLGIILSGRATAQTFTTLHHFPMPLGPDDTNTDGATPEAGVVLSGNTLYGTASFSGGSGNGSVFAVNTDGTGFTNLHDFTRLSVLYTGTNGDGAYPYGGLISSGNVLYGTAYSGGIGGQGAVFKVNTDGTGFTNLYSFPAAFGPYPPTNSSGANPRASLLLAGNILYGAATGGGPSGNGTIFALNTDGTGFTNLHSFTATVPPNPATNSDGGFPRGSLILTGDTLYGTATGGGRAGNGVVFSVKTDGTGFTNLHSFTARDSTYGTNSDGITPGGGMVLSGTQLFGTARYGGKSGQGTVFALNTDGTGFTNLHSFTNNEGSSLYAGLVSFGNTLYGAAAAGGITGYGTVFKLDNDGTHFSLLHTFTKLSGPQGNTNSDGIESFGGVIVSGDTLFGTALYGGNFGYGTVFSISLPLPPELSIVRSGTNVILTWSTNVAGLTLQSTTNLAPPAVWSTVSPGPVVVNGQNAVTNPGSSSQKYYRLIQ